MLTATRHTAILVLGFVILALVMACGGTHQPMPAPTLGSQKRIGPQPRTEPCRLGMD